MNKKPKYKLVGQDENIFNLVAIASKTLKQTNMEEQAKEMREKVFASGNYEEALTIISNYVKVR